MQRLEPHSSSLSENEERVIPFVLGKLPADKQGRLILGFTEGMPADAVITVNGRKVTDFSPTETPEPKGALAKNSQCYAAPFSFDAERYDVAFRRAVSAPVCISWIEIDAI